MVLCCAHSCLSWPLPFPNTYSTQPRLLPFSNHTRTARNLTCKCEVSQARQVWQGGAGNVATEQTQACWCWCC